MSTKWSNPAFAKFRKSIEQDEILCHQSDVDRRLFILIEGRLNVFVGGSRIAVVSEPGSFMGEMSFLSGKARTATVKAAEPTVVLIFDYGVVQQLVDMEAKDSHLPSITTVMLETLNTRYHAVKKKLDKIQKDFSARQTVYHEIFNDLDNLYKKKTDKNFYDDMEESEQGLPLLFDIMNEMQSDPLFPLTKGYVEVEDSALNIVREKSTKNIIPRIRVEIARRLCDHLSTVDEKVVNIGRYNIEIRGRCKECLERVNEINRKQYRFPELKEILAKYRDRLEIQ